MSATDYASTLPTCSACGTILPETSRLGTDRTKRECPHCRRICSPQEMFDQ